MAEEFRDIQCSNDVARMAELGKFDREFKVYGCTYREKDETYFHLSENAKTIADFWQRSQFEGVYPTVAMSHSQLSSVPSGMEDEIWNEEKWNLAEIMGGLYGDPFLDLLNDLGSKPPVNNAASALYQWKDAIDGRFRRDLLKVFDIFVKHCFLMKQLDHDSYSELKAWSAHVWKQLEDDLIIKDDFERTMYGYLCLTNNTVKPFYDAQFETVYTSWIANMKGSSLVTPIYSETFWFKTFTDFPKCKKQYIENLKSLLAHPALLLQNLTDKTAYISRNEFAKYFSHAQEVFSSQACETLLLYGKLWNCC